MTWRKRLRVIKAALTQQWHTHSCEDCDLTWHCQGKACNVWPVGPCADCQRKAFDSFHNRAQVARKGFPSEYQRGIS
jgi:hypothetical protein